MAARQARSVVAYLRSKGIKGSYVIRGERRAGSGNRARWPITITAYGNGC